MVGAPEARLDVAKRLQKETRAWQDYYEGSRSKKMSATLYKQQRIAAEGPPLTKTTEFEELYRELVEEAGRALEAEDLGWWAILQEVLIPKIDAEIHSVFPPAALPTLPTVRKGGAQR